MTRVCARIGCGMPLDHLRSDARYCSSTCRREAARQRRGISASENAQTFNWSLYRSRGPVAVRRGRSRHRKAAA